MDKALRKAYVKDESIEATRVGEKEFLIRNPPQFEYAPVRFWNKFIKLMQIERVR